MPSDVGYAPRKTGMFNRPGMGMLGERRDPRMTHGPAPEDTDALLRSLVVGENPGPDTGNWGGIGDLEMSNQSQGPFSYEDIPETELDALED